MLGISSLSARIRSAGFRAEGGLFCGKRVTKGGSGSIIQVLLLSDRMCEMEGSPWDAW